MRFFKFSSVVFFILFPILLSSWGAQAQYRHKTLLKDRYVHEPVATQDCTICHDLHFPEASGQLSEPVPDLCFTCHADPTDGRSVIHEPVKTGDCFGCHYPHSAPAKGLLKTTATELCTDCHAEKKEGRHGSLQFKGSCLQCHEPHASDSPGLLKVTSLKQCSTCHKDMDKGVYTHSALRVFDCSECHTPHASPPEPATECDECHDDKASESNVHPALEEGCSFCHDPHSSSYPDQLSEPVPDICLQCHEEKEGGRHGKAVMSTRCNSCHEPHSSSNQRLLKNLGNGTCTDCHSDKRGARNIHSAIDAYSCQHCHDPHNDPPKMPPTECRKCHTDIADRSAAHGTPSYGRCVQCHDPHGSDSPLLLREEVSGPIDDCLGCHRGIARDIDAGRHLHEPAVQGDCSDCHTAHEGSPPFSIERFDRRKTVPYEPEAYELCFQCHTRNLVETGFTEGDTGFRNGRQNLHNLHVMRDLERGFSCWVCHNPHASRQPHLIKMEVPFNEMYSLRIEYLATDNGGRCETSCHSVKEYER